MFGKKRIQKLEREVGEAFKEVKKDFVRVAKWIDFIDAEIKRVDLQEKGNENKIGELKQKLEDMANPYKENLIENFIKNPKQTTTNKQTNNPLVQTAVQTAVQTGNFMGFTTNEKVIIWTLLNTEEKVSHEDLAKLLGKNKSTIRGQINAIKKKDPQMISEFLELNGKKRLYIEENKKKKMIQILKIKKKKKSES